jgi:hypothetical protein
MSKPDKVVLLGTPCYGGSICADYASSLAASVSLFEANNMQLFPLFLKGQSVVQFARNKILHDALEMEFDDLVWIDADISWEPEDLLKLCRHKENIVGATYRKKIPEAVHFTLQMFPDKTEPDQNGLIEVSGIGTGFLKTSHELLKKVAESSKCYLDKGETIKNVFEVAFIGEAFTDSETLLSEDLHFCHKARKLGYKVMLDSTIDLSHVGEFVYRASFNHFLDYLKNKNKINF